MLFVSDCFLKLYLKQGSVEISTKITTSGTKTMTTATTKTSSTKTSSTTTITTRTTTTIMIALVAEAEGQEMTHLVNVMEKVKRWKLTC